MKKNRLTKGEKIFTVINTTLLILLSVMVLYPLWYIIISSVSDPAVFDKALNNGGIIILPQGFTLKYIMNHVKNMDIWRAYFNTVIYTVFGVIISMVLSILAAYVLSVKSKLSKVFMVIVISTIWFKPGMIATFLNIESLGLIGTRWGLLLPFAFSGFNVILLKTGFDSINKEVLESAEIDGASHFRKMWNISIPNAMPSIITVTLFYAIERWNGYFWAEMVLLKDELYPLQVIIKKMLQSGGDSTNLFEGLVSAFALIVIAIIPMLVIFPIIQKYFKKGIMDGSIK